MDKIPEALIKQFAEITKNGTEKEARDFLVKNIKSFPQELQDNIIGAFFEEAVIAKSTDLKLISDFQKQGLEMIKNLEEGKQKLEDKKKLLDIKESM